MGIKYVYDPDPTYELTTDNVKKILAIHMRFRLVCSFLLNWFPIFISVRELFGGLATKHVHNYNDWPKPV
jgi:hypothetical protein